MPEKQGAIIPARLLNPPHPARLLEEMPALWLELRHASAEHCDRIRKAYKKDKVQRDFKAYALEACCRNLGHLVPPRDLADIIDNYEVHHRRPISFGGTNERDNLILIAPYVHKAIHRRIDHIASAFHSLRTSYGDAGSQSERNRILDRLRGVEGLFTSHQRAGMRAFVKTPYPEGPFYIPHLAVRDIAHT